MDRELKKGEISREGVDDDKKEGSRQPEIYFAHTYGGFNPTFPYWNKNTSRFELGFNYNIFEDRAGVRSWWTRAYEEIARWLGNKDAAKRRQRERFRQKNESNRGKGPKNYQRRDSRIREDIGDLLWASDDLDASDTEIDVKNGEVTLVGTVNSRFEKRIAEDLAGAVMGVKKVVNLTQISSSN